MRAARIREPGGPEVLVIEEIEAPPLFPEGIRVRVCATALNRADLLQRRGLYPAPPGVRPDIPGLEYAGEVIACGSRARLWTPGARVMGLVGGGAYAEEVVVHEREAIPIPDSLSYTQAAAVPEAFMTAYDALFLQGALALGEDVLIHAIGSGVGTAGLQLAKRAGARVLGTSRTAAKLEAASELGLDVALPLDDALVDRVRLETEERGVHLLLDMLGGGWLDANLKMLGHRGRMITIGLLAGARGELSLGRLLQKNLRLLGSTLRSRPLEEKIALAQATSTHVVPGLASGALKPVVDRVMPFEAVAEAHHVMESNANFGKVVVEIQASHE